MSIGMIVLLALLLIAAQCLMVRLCNYGMSNNVDSDQKPCSEIRQSAISQMKKGLLDVAETPIDRSALCSIKSGPDDFMSYALRYSVIDFGIGVVSFDRGLLGKRYEYNSEYVMIGWYQENVPALMGVSGSDGRVYIDDYEDSPQGVVEEVAPSIEGYLALCYEIAHEELS